MKKRITRKSVIKQSIVREDIVSIIRVSLPRFVLMTVIIGFLLFFLNVLIGVSHHAQSFSETLQSKLAMYFYIKDTPSQEDATYAKVVQLQKGLEKAGVATDFVSKADAQKFLSNRIPDIVEQFDYYDIENPFPATLYVLINSEQDYAHVRDILPNYTDIILNVQDVTHGRTLADQEKRILKVMNLSQTVIGGSYFLIAFFLLIIVVIILFMIQSKFQEFHDKIELKKLLGASYMQIKLPFLCSSMLLLLGGFVLMLVLLTIVNTSIYNYDAGVQYFAQLFNLDIALGDSLKNYIGVGMGLLFAQILIFSALIWLIASAYLHRLVKRV